MRWAPLLRTLVASSTLLSAGCSLVFPAPTPMRTIARPAEAARPSRCLILFLPGFGDRAHDFVDRGFTDALRARSLPVDAVATDATFGYYASGTLLTRFREDVLRPAREKGYDQIWLVGISMGGIGSLLVARDQDPGIAGVFLIAPYLGDERLLREIAGAGGVAKWDPGDSKGDYQRDLWRFLKRVTEHPERAPLIYLGAGDRDKLAYGQRILAAALPKERLFSTPGIHDWAPWGILWAAFLDRSDFRTRCTEYAGADSGGP